MPGRTGEELALANVHVKRCGQPPATFFTTKYLKHCATSAHAAIVASTGVLAGSAQRYLMTSDWIVGDPEVKKPSGLETCGKGGEKCRDDTMQLGKCHVTGEEGEESGFRVPSESFEGGA